MLEVAVGDDLDALDVSCSQPGISCNAPSYHRTGAERTGDGKDLLEHVLGHAGREVRDVEMRAVGSLTSAECAKGTWSDSESAGLGEGVHRVRRWRAGGVGRGGEGRRGRGKGYERVVEQEVLREKGRAL